MPVQKCTKDGKPGFKWGEQGVCFLGEGAQEKAASVGRAIAAQKAGNLLFSSHKLSENKSKRVQVVKVGNFTHAELGKFSFTLPDLQEMKVNFDDNVRKQKIDGRPVLPFDYSHEDGEKAAGWIVQLVIEKDENNVDSLFAEVEWTPEGAERIKNNEFKFVSPFIHRGLKDSESGERHKIVLMGAALTNIPFLRDMEAVKLLSEYKKKAFQSLFKLSGDESDSNFNTGQRMTLEEIKGGLASLSPDDQKRLFEHLGKRMNKKTLAQDKKLSEDLEKSKKDLETEQDKLKLSEKELKDLKEKMGDSKDLEDRFKLSESKATKLSEKVNSLTATLAENESKGKFDAMLSEGKACEAQRKAYMSGNMEEFVANAEVIKLDEEGQRSKGDETVDNANEKVEKLAEEKAKSDNISFGDATKLVLSENPKLRKILGH